jgi:hypothetical protein
MAQSSTVDQAVVAAIVTEVTNVLSFGGKMNSSISLDGFSATISVEATLAPDVPELVKVP